MKKIKIGVAYRKRDMYNYAKIESRQIVGKDLEKQECGSLIKESMI